MPVMQPDQQFKRWKAAFLNFVRMKMPTLIPQLVLHQYRAVIHTSLKTSSGPCCSSVLVTIAAPDMLSTWSAPPNRIVVPRRGTPCVTA